MDFWNSIDWGGYLAPIGIGLLVLLYVVLVFAGWILNLFGLPGNWVIFIAAIGYDFVLRSSSRLELGVPLIAALGVLAVAGEACEWVAGALGVARKGGSRSSAVLALVGSAIGGIAGAIIGLPIPIVGSVIGVMFFASLGAMVGAVVGEDLQGRDLDRSLDIGIAAFWGRLFGSLAKTLIGAIMVAVALVGLMV